MPTIGEQRNRRFVAQILPHAGAAYNLARWIVRNEADAGDVVQEAFVRALKYFEGYHGGDARSWLLSIVRNTAYTWLKGRPMAAQPADAAAAADGDGGGPDPLREVSREDDARRLRRAIAQLPVEYREALVLREFEDLSYRQIAAIVDCPIGTVMSRLSRARDELGARLRAEEQG